MPILRTKKKLLCAALFALLLTVWITQRYLQSVEDAFSDIARQDLLILDVLPDPNDKKDANFIGSFEFTGDNLLSNLNFSNIDGGSWKQGWPVVYDRRSLPYLEVFIVPHSHVDVGWIKTIDSYYYDYVKAIIDNVVVLMQGSPGRRFVWSEIVYLQMWWDDPRTTQGLRAVLKDLILSGKFEILTGGWVIPDEASSGYESMIDQLILGHQWLEENVGKLKINCSFPVDIFGAGTAMPHIVSRAGIQLIVLQRVHYILKKYLARAKSLEFIWDTHRTDRKRQLLAHIEPFYSYDVPHTCGPEPEVCCAFDFERIYTQNCPWRYQPIYPSPKNIYEQASRLSDQYRKKASLYKHPVLLVPLGDDFRYKNAKSALTQFESYEILMNYINAKPHWNMQVKFGTISEYFGALRRRIHKGKDSFRTFSGDFFPYADKDEEYWTGYFVSRPHFKSIAHEMQTVLRAVEILHYFSEGFQNKYRNEEIMSIRRISAVLQHHDSITGTSPTSVMDDLMERIKQFYLLARSLLAKSSSELMNCSTPLVPLFSCSLRRDLQGCDKAPALSVKSQGTTKLVLFNSLEKDTEQLMRFRIGRDFPMKLTIGKGGQPVEHQILPLNENASELSFIAKVSALTFQTYQIWSDSKRDASETSRNAGVEQLGEKEADSRSTLQISNENFKITVENSNTITLRNQSDDTLLASLQVVKYKSEHPDFPPGAYICIMGTDGHSVEFNLKSDVTITHGPIYSSIKLAKGDRLLVELILINSTGASLSRGIHVKVNTNLSRVKENLEVALRFITTDKLEDVLTDSNGLQMTLRRGNRHLPGQANIYPFTRLVKARSRERRWSIISGQPRSVHLRPDQENTLELMLHRVTAADDQRGMGEPLVDKYPSSHRFILFPESLNALSSEADNLCQWMTHPLQKFTTHSDGIAQSHHLTEPSAHAAHIVSITSLHGNDRFLVVLAAAGQKNRKVRMDKLVDCSRYYRASLTGWEQEWPIQSCSGDPLLLDEALVSVVFTLD